MKYTFKPKTDEEVDKLSDEKRAEYEAREVRHATPVPTSHEVRKFRRLRKYRDGKKAMRNRARTQRREDYIRRGVAVKVELLLDDSKQSGVKDNLRRAVDNFEKNLTKEQRASIAKQAGKPSYSKLNKSERISLLVAAMELGR